jgi:hypothetical protein
MRHRAQPSASTSPVLTMPPLSCTIEHRWLPCRTAPGPHAACARVPAALSPARRWPDPPFLIPCHAVSPPPFLFPVSPRSAQSSSHHALAEPPHNVVAILGGQLELHHPDQPPKSHRVPPPFGASPSRPFPSFANAASAKASSEPPHLRTTPGYHHRPSRLFSGLRAKSQRHFFLHRCSSSLAPLFHRSLPPPATSLCHRLCQSCLAVPSFLSVRTPPLIPSSSPSLNAGAPCVPYLAHGECHAHEEEN